MDPPNCELACGLVSRAYICQGAQALSARSRLVKALLSSRRMPERGWDEASIEQLVQVTLVGPGLRASAQRYCGSACGA